MPVYRTTNRWQAEEFCLSLRESGYTFDPAGIRRNPKKMQYRTHLDPSGRFVVVYWKERRQAAAKKPCSTEGCSGFRSFASGECKRCYDVRRYREDPELRERKRAYSRKHWKEFGGIARELYNRRRAERRRQMQAA